LYKGDAYLKKSGVNALNDDFARIEKALMIYAAGRNFRLLFGPRSKEFGIRTGKVETFHILNTNKESYAMMVDDV